MIIDNYKEEWKCRRGSMVATFTDQFWHNGRNTEEYENTSLIFSIPAPYFVTYNVL
jgi:hypothetical protein